MCSEKINFFVQRVQIIYYYDGCVRDDFNMFAAVVAAPGIKKQNKTKAVLCRLPNIAMFTTCITLLYDLKYRGFLFFFFLLNLISF